jgi:hypothetical protein
MLQRMESAEEGPERLRARVARELTLAFARDAGRFADARGNQSAFMREAVELFVGAAEKVANDIRLTQAYAAVREELTEDERAAARASRIAARRRRRAV